MRSDFSLNKMCTIKTTSCVLQCKVTKTSMAPFRTPDFDRRFYLAALLHWTADSACSQNTGHRTPFSVSFLGSWSFTCQHSGGIRMDP